MATVIVTSSAANVRSFSVNGEMLGGVAVNGANGSFVSLPTQLSSAHLPDFGTVLTATFSAHSSSIVKALNRVASLAVAANPGGENFQVQFNNSEVFAGLPMLQIEGPTAANTTHKVHVQASGGLSLSNPSTPGTDVFTVSQAGAVSGALGVSAASGTFQALTGFLGKASISANGAISGTAGSLLSLAAGTNIEAANKVMAAEVTASGLSHAATGTFQALTGFLGRASIKADGVVSGTALQGNIASIGTNVTAGGQVQGATIVGTTSVSGAAINAATGTFQALSGFLNKAHILANGAISGTAGSLLTLDAGTNVTAGGTVQGANIVGTTGVSGVVMNAATGTFQSLTGFLGRASINAGGEISGGVVSVLNLAAGTNIEAANKVQGAQLSSSGLSLAATGTFQTLNGFLGKAQISANGAISGTATSVLSLAAGAGVQGATVVGTTSVSSALGTLSQMSGVSLSGALIHVGKKITIQGTKDGGGEGTFALNVSGGILRLVEVA